MKLLHALYSCGHYCMLFIEAINAIDYVYWNLSQI